MQDMCDEVAQEAANQVREAQSARDELRRSHEYVVEALMARVHEMENQELESVVTAKECTNAGTVGPGEAFARKQVQSAVGYLLLHAFRSVNYRLLSRSMVSWNKNLILAQVQEERHSSELMLQQRHLWVA